MMGPMSSWSTAAGKSSAKQQPRRGTCTPMAGLLSLASSLLQQRVCSKRIKESLMKKALIISLILTSVAALGGSDEGIRLEVMVAASVDEVWEAWTTVEGVKSFFAADARIDLRPDGPYEIFFDPSAPAGKRGADDMRVMLVQPKTALAFTWNAPEKFPNARGQRTHVMVRFVPES